MRSASSALRRAAAELMPPILYRAARRTWRRDWTPGYEVAARWSPPAAGWNQDSVADAERAAWPTYLRRFSPTGVLGAEDSGRRLDNGEPWRHNLAMSFAYVLILAEAGRGRLSVLDWGGSLGQFHLVAKGVLPGVELRYEVKDLPTLCRVGRELQPDLTFHEDERCLEGRYDLVTAMSSLQYSEQWRGTLARLGAAASSYLYVSRLPIVFAHPSFLVLQRAYGTEYVGWVLNRDEFLAAAAGAGLRLVREFLCDEAPHVRRAPEQLETRGFLFAPGGAR